MDIVKGAEQQQEARTRAAHLNANVPPKSQALDQLAVVLQLLQLLQDLLFLLLAQLLLGLQHRELRRRPQLRRDATTDKRLGANATRNDETAAAWRRKNGQLSAKGLTLKRTMCFRHVLLAVAIAAAW